MKWKLVNLTDAGSKILTSFEYDNEQNHKANMKVTDMPLAFTCIVILSYRRPVILIAAVTQF